MHKMRHCVALLLILLLWAVPAPGQNLITSAYDVNRIVYVSNAIDRINLTFTPERAAIAIFIVKLYSIDNDITYPNPSPNNNPNFPSGTALRLIAQAQDKFDLLYKSPFSNNKPRFAMESYDIAAAMLGLIAEQPGNPVANTITAEALNFETYVGYRVSDDPTRPPYLQQSNTLGGSRVAGGFSRYQNSFFEKMFDLARQNPRVASVVDAFFAPVFKCSVLDNTFVILNKNPALRDSQNFAPFVQLIQQDGRVVATKAEFNSRAIAFSSRMNSVTTTATTTLATITATQTSNYAAFYLNPNPTALAAVADMKAIITPKLEGAQAASYALPFTIKPDPRYTAYQQTVAGLELGSEIAFVAAASAKLAAGIATVPFGAPAAAEAAFEIVGHGLLVGARAMDLAAAYGKYGSSDEEVIMDGINQLSQQLHSVQQQINARFDIIDAKLNTIYTTMNAQFDIVKDYLVNINVTLTQVQNQVRSMQLAINTVQSDIYRLSQFIYIFANEMTRTNLVNALDEIDTVSRNGTPIDINRYSDLYAAVKSYALVHAKESAEVSDWNTANRSYTDLALVTELSLANISIPEWNINYILEFARRKWALTLGPSTGVANPRAWAMSVTGMMRLAAAKPAFFEQTTLNDSASNGDGFYGTRNVGRDIEQAVADCTIRFNPTTSRYEKSLLFRRLMDFQQQKATALVNAITAVENATPGTLAQKVAGVRAQWNAQTPTNEGAALQNAIKEFDGSRRLLDAFTELGLSRSLAINDTLRSFLYSPQRLPDALVVNNPGENDPAAARSLYGKYNGEAANPKDAFLAAQSVRWAALDVLLQRLLDYIVTQTTRDNPVGEPIAEVDNLLARFGYFTLSRIEGRVRPLPNQGQFIPGEPIYLTFRSRTNSQPILTLTTTLDAISNFRVAVPPDNYDVLIRTAKYLQKGVYGVDARNGGIPLSSGRIDVQLTVGELFFDNRIDNRDMVVLRNSWGVSRYLPGDINRDGTVDINDLLLLISAYNTVPGNPNWNVNADINHNGSVDISDLLILIGNYNRSGFNPNWNPLADLNSDNKVDDADLSLLLSPAVWGQLGDN